MSTVQNPISPAKSGGNDPIRPANRRLKAEVVVPALAFVFLVPLYSALSILDYRKLKTFGFDLGIFVQEVSSYAHLQLPTSDLLGTGYSTLGDHFSPITALLAPFYYLYPSPATLLAGQAVLLALGVVPLSRWAAQEFGAGVACIVALGYGLSWGLQSALNFDFHEVAFGVPLVAFSMVALGRRRWSAALLWALPLVFVKEDLGLTVAVIGGLVAFWTTGRTRRAAVATAVWGIAWTVLSVKVIIPFFSADDAYSQGSKLPALGAGIADTAHGIVSGDSRAATLFLMLAITGFAVLRSPLTLVIAPTIAWRFLSDNRLFWLPIFHYNAILMPILFAALIDAVVRGRSDGHLSVRARRVVFGIVALVAVGSLPFQPLSGLRHAENWTLDPQAAAARRIATRIPAQDSVSASNNLVTQFVSSHDVTVFPQREANVTTPDWIVVDVARPPNWPTDADGDKKAVGAALATGYVVDTRFHDPTTDGIEVLRRVDTQ